MYAALWRKLPGPAPVKWLLTLILLNDNLWNPILDSII